MASNPNDLWLAAENGYSSYEDFKSHVKTLTQRPDISEQNRDFLMNVSAEISQHNFLRMIRVQTLLDPLIEEEIVLSTSEINEIRSIGNEINSQGGISAMRMCYYTLVKILMTSRNSRDLQFLWDGIGSWQM